MEQERSAEETVAGIYEEVIKGLKPNRAARRAERAQARRDYGRLTKRLTEYDQKISMDKRYALRRLHGHPERRAVAYTNWVESVNAKRFAERATVS